MAEGSRGLRPKKVNLAVLGEMSHEPTLAELDYTIALSSTGKGKRRSEGGVGRKRMSALPAGETEAEVGEGYVERKRGRPSKQPAAFEGYDDDAEVGATNSAAATATSLTTATTTAPTAPTAATAPTGAAAATAGGAADVDDGDDDNDDHAEDDNNDDDDVDAAAAAAADGDANEDDERTETASVQSLDNGTAAQPVPAWASHSLLQGIAVTGLLASGRSASSPFGHDGNTAAAAAATTPTPTPAQTEEGVRRAFGRVVSVLQLDAALQCTLEATECLDGAFTAFPAQLQQGWASDMDRKRMQLRQLLAARRHIDEALGRFLLLTKPSST